MAKPWNFGQIYIEKEMQKYMGMKCYGKSQRKEKFNSFMFGYELANGKFEFRMMRLIYNIIL